LLSYIISKAPPAAEVASSCENKQLRTAYKTRSSSPRLWRKITTTHTTTERC